jgi:dephospho-CoA kinase
VVLVDAPAEIRRQRLVQQRGLTAEEANALLRAQMPPELKRQRSDIVLQNAGSLEALHAAAREAWRRIVSRAA